MWVAIAVTDQLECTVLALCIGQSYRLTPSDINKIALISDQVAVINMLRKLNNVKE